MNQGNTSTSPILEATINGRNILVRVTPEPPLEAAKGVTVRVVLSGNSSEGRLSAGATVAPVAQPDLEERMSLDEEVEEEPVNVGQRVEGQFYGIWYLGTITVVGVDETDGYTTMIMIKYDDGDVETAPFPNERIRILE